MLLPVRRRLLLGCAPFAVACGGPDVGSAASVDGAPSSSHAATSGGDSWPDATDANSSGSSEFGEGGQKFDLAGPSDLGGAAPGCNAIDFLFVIDNSGSMQDYQANLVASFPGFVDGLYDALETVQSLRVAVTTSDAYIFNVPECTWLGSSVVRTGGDYSSESMCGPYAAGKNYMTEADDLAETFACAARVGTGGDAIERPMGAVVNAMRATEPGTAPCNGRFVRDEALLVIVVLSDEYDGPNDPEGDGSAGDPSTWRAAVLDAKGGLESNVAAVVLTNYPGGACEPTDPGHDGSEMKKFADSFGDNGFVAGICEEDYSIPLAQALDVILEACQDFVPPG